MLKKILIAVLVILCIGFATTFLKGYLYQSSKAKQMGGSSMNEVDSTPTQDIIDDKIVSDMLDKIENIDSEEETEKKDLPKETEPKNDTQGNQNTQKENQTTTSPKQDTPQQITPPTTPNNPIVETPVCKSKKFDMNWIRADFNSFDECVTVGNKYKEIGYGYFCDNYQDDCKTTYYMLTLYERNTGKEYDFHTISLP